MLVLKVLFWLSLGALVWTHVAYPLGAAALARVRTRIVRKEAIEPTVTVIVAAYNEEAVIERRLENLLALDYPADKLEIVVTSDASTDRTEELAEAAADVGDVRVGERGGELAQRVGRPGRVRVRERDHVAVRLAHGAVLRGDLAAARHR